MMLYPSLKLNEIDESFHKLLIGNQVSHKYTDDDTGVFRVTGLKILGRVGTHIF